MMTRTPDIDIGELRRLQTAADAAYNPVSSQRFNPGEAAYYTALRNAAPALLAAAEEGERLGVQLAGCGVAAMGGTTEPVVAKRDDYGWSPSYQSVLDLRREYDTLKSRLAAAEAVVSAVRESLHETEMMNAWTARQILTSALSTYKGKPE